MDESAGASSAGAMEPVSDMDESAGASSAGAMEPVPPSPSTTTMPVIQGCTMHRYGYSPGSSNVTSKVSPGMDRPLSNCMGESGELVTVCAAVSSLDHVTVEPGATDTPAGT